MNLLGVAFASQHLHKLNDDLNNSKIIKMKEKFPVLRTRRKSAETWWNSLKSKDERFEVAQVAFHYNLFSVNYCWDTNEEINFSNLKKSQKNFIKFAFNKREYNWYMFDITSMLMNSFK